MEKASFVAGPSTGIVNFEFSPTAYDRGFVHRYKRPQEFDVGVGAGLNRLSHREKKGFPAVRIDGVIARMGGNRHGFGPETFGIAGGKGQKNTVSERNDGFFHREFLVMAVGNFTPGFQEVGLEGFGQKGQRHDLILDAEAAALIGGTGEFPGVMLGSIVEAESGHDLFSGGHVMEDGDRIQPS